jgi:hypothetical protein
LRWEEGDVRFDEEVLRLPLSAKGKVPQAAISMQRAEKGNGSDYSLQEAWDLRYRASAE